MYDVIIIGSGPAGMMAAISARYKNKKVLLIEKNNVLGKKLLLTGGSRCNITNNKNIKEFINNIDCNPKAIYSTLNNFGPKEIISFFEKRGVRLKEEENNKIFPRSDKSIDIVNAFIAELNKLNTDIHLNEEVIKIIFGEIKSVVTNKCTYEAKSVIIATGGLSYKHTGSTGFGYDIAKKYKINITKLYPVESSVYLESPLPCVGVTFKNTCIYYQNKIKSGSLIITHKGLSGPVIFKISEYIYKSLDKDRKVYIDFLCNKTKEELIKEMNNYESKRQIRTFIKEHVNVKLADYILYINGIDGAKKIASTSNKDKEKIIKSLKKLELKIKKVEEIDKSVVTGGGISILEIDTTKMESKKYKGVFFVGEVLDFHGPIGGYNLTIALSTGYTAGIFA
ncbi:MAG TPA: aminoacetone oxidase family FAD-binding enzyme [Tenericutes bacterium]|nr:aminoacetone oxidase family FAD-binding enzyme [Mycoplasmatota bacterium]